MNFEFEELKSTSAWDDSVIELGAGTVFHQSPWLETASKFSKQALLRLGCHANGDLVLAIPLFLGGRGPVRTILSPPPRLGMQQLGPLLRNDILGSSTREGLRLELIDALLKTIFHRFGPALLYIRTVPQITDARPFRWKGCTVEVLYSYVKKLPERIEDLIPTFHRRVRTYLRQAGGPVDVRPGGRELCVAVHKFVAHRFADQGKSFGPKREYLTSLFDALGPARFQPVGAYTEHGLEAAAIITFHQKRASFWQHASGSPSSRLPLTDHLIWQGMNLAAQRGCTEFELVGANTPRLIGFKTKFSPDLEQFFEISKASVTGRIARAIYSRVRR